MKIKIDLADNFIDVWNEKEEIWERYVKVGLEEQKKLPKKLELPSFIEFKTMSPEERYVMTAKEYDVLNEIIDYLKSKGE